MMRGFLLTSLVASLVLGALPNVASAGPLDALRWSKRVLLVFSSGDGLAESRQRAEFSQGRQDELAERDLLVVDVPARGEANVFFGIAAGPLDAAALHKAYDVPAGSPFTTVLVGKDGGVKWREERPASADELFRLIDSMPMRARERRKS